MSNASPLVKFMHEHGPGNTTQWGRADLDGAPYRGAPLPPLPEEELEDRLVKTFDVKNRVFDLANAEDNKAYLDVLDRIANKWYMLAYRDITKTRHRRITVSRDADGNTVRNVSRPITYQVYMEWTECYMQDGKPMHAQQPYMGRSNA